jgi:hypothetical protein
MGSQLALSNTGSEFGEFGVHRRLGLGLHRPIVANQSLANCELGAPRYNGYWLPRLCHGNSVEHTSRAKSGHASCRCDRIAPLCASFGSEYPQRDKNVPLKSGTTSSNPVPPYTSVRLAQMLERGLFDGLFLADVGARSCDRADSSRRLKPIRPEHGGGSQATDRARLALRDRKFVDSPLEGDGFELLVPPRRTSPRARHVVSRSAPPTRRGTDPRGRKSSNPASSRR